MVIRLNNFGNIAQTPFVSTLKNKFLRGATLPSLRELHLDTVEFNRLPKKVSIKHYEFGGRIPSDVDVLVNPNNNGMIYKKIFDNQGRLASKEPVSVNVAYSQKSVFDQFHFLDKKTNEEIGYVQFFNSKNSLRNETANKYYENTLFCRNYPGYGFSKDRLVVEMIYNNKEKEYGGIGKLVDQLAVEFCLKNGIKPRSIMAAAEFNSHAVHYKLGRRFIKDVHLGDVNSYIKNWLKTAIPGEKLDTSKFDGVMMYFPKSMVNRIIEDIKKNPIIRD